MSVPEHIRIRIHISNSRGKETFCQTIAVPTESFDKIRVYRINLYAIGNGTGTFCDKINNKCIRFIIKLEQL